MSRRFTPVRNRLAAGFKPSPADWKELRDRHELSQSGLARCLKSGGISVRLIQAWEQGENLAPASTWRYVLAQMGELVLPERLKD